MRHQVEHQGAQTFEAFVHERFGGELYAGAHEENGEACIFEAWNAYRGYEWSDSPDIAECYDLRFLNDIPVGHALRTPWMIVLAASYAGSLDWPLARQERVVGRLILLTVQRLMSRLPDISMECRQRCVDVRTVAEVASAIEGIEAAAWSTVKAAAWSPAEAAAWAAGSAAEVAIAAATSAWASAAAIVGGTAARAAWAAEVKHMCIIACTLWLEAAQESDSDRCTG